MRVGDGGALCLRRAPSGDLADVHAKSRRAASSGVCMAGICRMSPGRSPVDWKESRKENLLVNDEGKRLLRCAERDARRASSGISRGEMRESHVSLETPLDEEIANFGSWWTHGVPCGNGELPRTHGEVWAPCRWTGAMQMLERAPCRWAGAMLALETRGAAISEFSSLPKSLTRCG